MSIQSILLNVMARWPLGMLYAMSDVMLYPAMRYFPGYRKRIVRKNIGLAFCKETAKRRNEIERGFYRHLGHILVETLKMSRLSASDMSCRMKWEIAGTLEDDAKARPVVCYTSHYANWEWLVTTLPAVVKCNVYIIYSELHNKQINEWMLRQRSRFGARMVSMGEVGSTISELIERGEGGIIIALADQLPKEQYVRHFSRLLGIKSKVITGTEAIVKRYGLPVYNHRMIKTGSGRYKNIISRLEPTGDGDWPLTDAYNSALDAQLREQPEFWLWSHDRWHR